MVKLLRYGERGQEKPAILDNEGNIRDLSSHFDTEMPFTFSYIEKLRELDIQKLDVVDQSVRIGACLAKVPNFFCIGLNYATHAAETNLRIPREPVLFSKASSALSGPFDPIILPKGAEKADWEVELGVVIGKTTYQISEEDALDSILGYCTVNDLSERHFQTERSGQWIKGKSSPGFGPIGPYLVSADEIDDPQNLDLSLKVNGETMQNANTSDMIFSIARIISYMSQFMTLQAGDIIATGTPSGVGMGMDPQKFLKDGDVLETYVEGLGTQRQKVIATP